MAGGIEGDLEYVRGELERLHELRQDGAGLSAPALADLDVLIDALMVREADLLRRARDV